MATGANLWIELKHTFARDIPNIAELLELLQRERRALEERDYDTFSLIISKKQDLLTTIEQQAKIRQQLLQSAGFSDEASTLSAADEQAPNVAKAWRKLGEQWKKCQELNEINERITQRTRLVVGQMLDLLRGTTGHTRVYDNKGGTRPTGSGHTITSA